MHVLCSTFLRACTVSFNFVIVNPQATQLEMTAGSNGLDYYDISLAVSVICCQAVPCQALHGKVFASATCLSGLGLCCCQDVLLLSRRTVVNSTAVVKTYCCYNMLSRRTALLVTDDLTAVTDASLPLCRMPTTCQQRFSHMQLWVGPVEHLHVPLAT